MHPTTAQAASAVSSALPITGTATLVPAVALDRVSRLYGGFVALREVSLLLPPGASAVLLGENGAGKSTLLKLVAGLTAPTFGHVSVFGEPPQNEVRRGRIGYMSHATMLYDELTGRENLVYFAGLHAERAARNVLEQTATAALLEVGLDPANPRRVGQYSQGMRQRAALARVLQTEPDLLLLDEPFSNLDSASIQRMIERLRSWRMQPGRDGRHRTLLLTTHQAELARPLATALVTLNEGRILSHNLVAAP